MTQTDELVKYWRDKATAAETNYDMLADQYVKLLEDHRELEEEHRFTQNQLTIYKSRFES